MRDYVLNARQTRWKNCWPLLASAALAKRPPRLSDDECSALVSDDKSAKSGKLRLCKTKNKDRERKREREETGWKKLIDEIYRGLSAAYGVNILCSTRFMGNFECVKLNDRR